MRPRETTEWQDPILALELLREAVAPITFAELRQAGVATPGQALYRLGMDGHRIERTAAGVRLVDPSEPAPVPPPITPRVRVVRRGER